MANVIRVTHGSRPAYSFRPAAFPDHPGCYLMKDENDRVIYVGKANSLRHRVASYFRESEAPHRKTEMIDRIRDIEVVLVRNDREALVLESNLIRHHNPPFNSRFTRDDDSYYYIAITDELFPRVVPYRKRRANFAVTGPAGVRALFGPYVGWRLRNRLLDAVRSAFPLRTCHSLPERACLRRAGGACTAPCAGETSVDAYDRIVASARRFLARPPRSFLCEIERQMEEASTLLDFERASTLRDRLAALEHAALPQAVERHRPRDLDVLYVEGGRLLALRVCDGAVVEISGPHVVGDSAGAVDRWIGDAPRLIVHGKIDWSVLRKHRSVQVSMPGRSYAGQLLELCRINLAYRMSG